MYIRSAPSMIAIQENLDAKLTRGTSFDLHLIGVCLGRMKDGVMAAEDALTDIVGGVLIRYLGTL